MSMVLFFKIFLHEATYIFSFIQVIFKNFVHAAQLAKSQVPQSGVEPRPLL